MRLNRYVALATGMSRRQADEVITNNRVTVNGQTAQTGSVIDENTDDVRLDGKVLAAKKLTTIAINKPAGLVVSRSGQGANTVYDLLPKELHHLKPIGRLDKDSSGLLLLTNDGQLAAELTHPRYKKVKIYEVELDRPLTTLHQKLIADSGVELDDGLSRLDLKLLEDGRHCWQVKMSEGRNRQIRRTFAAIGYQVKRLHRTNFGTYELSDLSPKEYRILQ